MNMSKATTTIKKNSDSIGEQRSDHGCQHDGRRQRACITFRRISVRSSAANTGNLSSKRIRGDERENNRSPCILLSPFFPMRIQCCQHHPACPFPTVYLLPYTRYPRQGRYFHTMKSNTTRPHRRLRFSRSRTISRVQRPFVYATKTVAVKKTSPSAFLKRNQLLAAPDRSTGKWMTAAILRPRLW